MELSYHLARGFSSAMVMLAFLLNKSKGKGKLKPKLMIDDHNLAFGGGLRRISHSRKLCHRIILKLLLLAKKPH